MRFYVVLQFGDTTTVFFWVWHWPVLRNGSSLLEVHLIIDTKTCWDPMSLQDIFYRKAQWNDTGGFCAVVSIPLSDLLYLYIPGKSNNVGPSVLQLLHNSAMSFDFAVLILCAMGLRRSYAPRSPLQALVYKQGLLYFVIAFTSNLLPVVSQNSVIGTTVLILFISTLNRYSSSAGVVVSWNVRFNLRKGSKCDVLDQCHYLCCLLSLVSKTLQLLGWYLCIKSPNPLAMFSRYTSTFDI